MNKLLKQFVAFSIAAVMVLGMMPIQSLAAGQDEVSTLNSSVKPFSGTADLIEQVKAQLVEEGKLGAYRTADQAAVSAVERESHYSYNEAMTAIVMGLLNNRSGDEGRIDVSYLNLSAGTMDKLIEDTVRVNYLDDSFRVSYEEQDGIVTAIHFALEDAFGKVMDQVDLTNAVEAAHKAAAIQSLGEISTARTFTVTDAATYAAPRFSDVPSNMWYAEPIAYAAEHGLMSGVGNGKFEPETPMTRAMAVQVLYRIAGSPEVSGKNPFRDVPQKEWFYTAVIWAVQNEITGGTSKNTFSPNELVNREQLVTFLYKYAKTTGMDMPKTDISGFRDAKKIDSWAVEPFRWAVKVGAISGVGNNMLAPLKSATRAECAAILAKFDKMVKENEGNPTEPTDPSKPVEPTDPTNPVEPTTPVDPSHEIIHVPAKPANCKEDGNIEYWYCKTHDKYFADEARTHEITKEDTIKPRNLHAPAVDNNGNFVDTKFNWAQIPPILLDEKGQPVIGEDGNPKLNPEVVFVDENGQPIMYNGQPAVVGAYLDGTPITSITLTFDAEKKEINAMPTTKPDYWLDWIDEDDNHAAMSEAELQKAYENIHHRDSYMCTSVTYKCAGCGEEYTEEVELTNVLMTQQYIDKTLEDYGAQVAQKEIEDYVTNKTIEYMTANNGQMPSEEQQNAWVAEIQPQAEQKAQQAAGMKAMELYPNLNSTVYTATSKVNPDIKESVDATKEQLMRNWGIMKQFNAAYPQYLGYAAPYWTSKNTEANPLDAVIYMCNAQEEPFVPVYNMDFMVAMLSQAFMSYVMQYGPMIDPMLQEAKALVNHSELDQIDKLLLLHDWVAQYGTFDMQSMIDQTNGTSSGSDPIAMTIFGTLLRSQIPDDPNKEVEWDGAVCLGYTSTYAILLQQVFGVTSTENPIVDFVQIKYLSNVAETSVAAGESGFGDGDAMFNSPHFFNAVKLSNGNWYYVDTCYDDVNVEVISQYRVETEGNISHDNFLLSPLTVIDMYEGNFQFIDSLYDEKVWERVPDGQGGFKMKTMIDGKEHIYETENAAKDAQKQAEEKGETLQLFYVYEEKPAPAGTEKAYNDTTYEEAWFVHANSAVQYDPATQYFYYASGMVNSYSSMKDIFKEDENGEDGSQPDFGDMGENMDMGDLMEFKDNPSSQDKLVRRPVNAKNEPEPKEEGSMDMSMNGTVDPFAEHLFHYGYGTIGAQAHKDVLTDKDKGFMDENTTDGREGPYFDLCVEDKDYFERYPDMTHAMVAMDGKLYFNVGHSIYTFNKTISELGQQKITDMNDLELVKVKEYNDVTYSHNGKRFVGGGFVTDPKGQDSLRYHPIAALDVHNQIIWTDADGDQRPDGRQTIPTLFVSIATNLSNSFKGNTEEFYQEEAYNYNPNFFRFNDENKTEEEKEKENDNVEFMWCANVVDKMPVNSYKFDTFAPVGGGYNKITMQATGLVEDLKTAGQDVSVKAYCNHNAFTESRTQTYGLTVGEKTEQEGTALKHKYAMNDKEKTNICSVCLQDHDHAEDTIKDENVTWEYTSKTEDKAASMKATAKVTCSDDFCNLEQKTPEKTVDAVQDGNLWKATFTVGSGDEAKDIVKTHTHKGNTPAPEAELTVEWNYIPAVEGDKPQPESVQCNVILDCDCGAHVKHSVETTASEDGETWTATYEGRTLTHTHKYTDGVCTECGKGSGHVHDLVLHPESETWTYTKEVKDGDTVVTPEGMTVSAGLECQSEHCEYVEQITDLKAEKQSDGSWKAVYNAKNGQEITLTHTHDYEVTKESTHKWKYTAEKRNEDGTLAQAAQMHLTVRGTCDCGATHDETVECVKSTEEGTGNEIWTGEVQGVTFTHKHSYGEKGTCDCGATQNDCDHNWGKWTIDEEPSCNKVGHKSRKCSKCGKVETEEIPMIAHTFELPEDAAASWKYNAETEKVDCSVQLVCSVCGATKTETVEATETEGVLTATIEGKEFEHRHVTGTWTTEKEPTCTEEGLKKTTCNTCSAPMSQVIPALGHDCKATSDSKIVWTYNNETGEMTAKVICKCSRCNQTEEKDAVVTKSETEEKWTAKVDEVSFEHTHTYDQADGTKCVCGAVKSEEQHDHTYGEPKTEWAEVEGKWTCTRTWTCTDPECKDPIKTENGAVTSETVPATCTEKAKTIYTATFKEGEPKTDTKTIESGEPLGHDWGEPEYVWADGGKGCTAERVCKTDAHHVETATATITSQVTKQPTETEKGKTTYTATFKESWAETQTLTLEDIPAKPAEHKHEMVPHEAKAATCTEAGNKEYWHCSGCNKDFADAEGKQEVAAEDLVIKALGHDFKVAKTDKAEWIYHPEVKKTEAEVKQEQMDEIRAQYKLERKSEKELNAALKAVEESVIAEDDLPVAKEAYMECVVTVSCKREGCTATKKLDAVKAVENADGIWVATVGNVEFKHEHVLKDAKAITSEKWLEHEDGTVWCTIEYTCAECNETATETKQANKIQNDENPWDPTYEVYFGDIRLAKVESDIDLA